MVALRRATPTSGTRSVKLWDNFPMAAVQGHLLVNVGDPQGALDIAVALGSCSRRRLGRVI